MRNTLLPLDQRRDNLSVTLHLHEMVSLLICSQGTGTCSIFNLKREALEITLIISATAHCSHMEHFISTDGKEVGHCIEKFYIYEHVGFHFPTRYLNIVLHESDL